MFKSSLLMLTLSTTVTASSTPPSIDLLSSIWQPMDAPVYGAPSVTNAWGSLLVSTQSVLGFNAVEMPPFSSGWSASNLYGWPVDTATLSINNSVVPPSNSLWTPYSVIRNGSISLLPDSPPISVNTEVRWVFEGQGILLEANITVMEETYLSFEVDLRFPMRYYPRADECSSWHYPTHSEPCCWNWFPSEPASGDDSTFIVNWLNCSSTSATTTTSSSYATMVSRDPLSPTTSAFSFPNACNSSGKGSGCAETPNGNHNTHNRHPLSLPRNDLEILRRSRADSGSSLLDLSSPDAVNNTIAMWHGIHLGGSTSPSTARIRIALVFSNTSDIQANAEAARALADSFEVAWSDAQNDWQNRFNAAFDPSQSHFSGHLPLLSTTTATSSKSSAAENSTTHFDQTVNSARKDERSNDENQTSFKNSFDFTFTDGFSTPMERIYYSSIIGLLANERTNFPPSLPSNPGACPVSSSSSATTTTYEAEVVIVQAPSSRLLPAQYKSGLDRYLIPYKRVVSSSSTSSSSTNEEWVITRLTGSSYSGGGHANADYANGRRATKFRRSQNDSHASSTSSSHSYSGTELLNEADVPWRMFMTGGGLNATSNIFYWDNQYSAQLLMTLEPDTMSRQLLLWLSSTDEFGVPSYWSFWGYDYVSRRGLGNYYGANDFTLAELLHAYLRTTTDYSILNITLSIPYPNGTIVQETMYDIAYSITTHWRHMNASGCLADYGGAPNLLECVPTYVHRVSGVNAANAWMSLLFADIAEGVKGDNITATQLRADADCIANAILNRLYVPGKGYFAVEMLNNSHVVVMHVMDHVYTTLYLGVQGGEAGDGSTAQYIPVQVATEMQAFVETLRVPTWMRALSLNDTAAGYSNRSDHGPSGSYIGWPALSIRSMGVRRDFGPALAFLNDTLFSATLGPYGQANEVRPPGAVYKPMVFTLYNAMVSASFADTVMQTFFGFHPSPQVPNSSNPPPSSPLIDASYDRGFVGILSGVVWNGNQYDIISGPSGLSLVPL